MRFHGNHLIGRSCLGVCSRVRPPPLVAPRPAFAPCLRSALFFVFSSSVRSCVRLPCRRSPCSSACGPGFCFSVLPFGLASLVGFGLGFALCTSLKLGAQALSIRRYSCISACPHFVRTGPHSRSEPLPVSGGSSRVLEVGVPAEGARWSLKVCVCDY